MGNLSYTRCLECGAVNYFVASAPRRVALGLLLILESEVIYRVDFWRKGKLFLGEFMADDFHSAAESFSVLLVN